MKNILQYIKNHELLSVILILSCLLLIFLSPVIFTWRYFAPADIIRNTAPFVNGVKPHNFLLSDVLFQFVPWFALSKDLIWHGNFPLWNTYSGGGLPLFANMQSAVLFPLTWFFYIFQTKIALLLYGFFKLLVIGFFTYLYLRIIKCSKKVSLGGAIGFMFAGFNVVWLLWPHTNVVFLLPLGCYLIERFMQGRKAIFLLFFSLAIAIGIFAGHPETFFHISLFLGIYAAFKVLSSGSRWTLKLKDLFKLSGAAIWGLLISAVLLLPFLEYLKYSGVLVSRSNQINGYFLPKLAIFLNAIPDFFGNPGLRHIYYANFSNYNESAMGYVGVFLLLCAFYALIWEYKNKLVLFYGMFLLFCASVIYHIKFIFDLVVKLPGFSTGANHRLLLIFAFCVVVLGCIGIESILQNINDRKKIAFTSSIFFIAVSLLFILNRLWSIGFISPEKLHLIKFWQLAFYFIFVTVLIISVFLLTRLNFPRTKYLVILVIFLETGLHGLFFNTSTKNEDFYPKNNVVNFLLSQTAKDSSRVLFLNGIFPPNLGSYYKINQVADYDAVYLNSYQNFKSEIGSFSGSPEMLEKVNNFSALKLLSVNYIVSTGLPLLSGQSLVYFENGISVVKQNALPRAFFVPAANTNELKNKVQDFIQKQKEFPFMPVENFQVQENGSSFFTVNNSSDGYIFESENYFPGWKSEIDGRPGVVENVLGFKAVKISKDAHAVKVFYKPSSFSLGLKISLASLVLWLAVVLWIKRLFLRTIYFKIKNFIV